MAPPALTPQIANDDLCHDGDFAPLRWIVGFGFLTSLITTYPLWLSSRAFPLIPLHPLFAAPAYPFDLLFLLLLGAMIITTIVTPSGYAALAILIQVLILWAQDENRIHPWVFFPLLVYGALAPLWLQKPSHRKPFETVTLLQYVTIAIYGWTGIQKIRTTYFLEVVPRLLDSFSPLSSLWGTALESTLLAVPFIEIALALLLLSQRTRRIGVVGIVLLHISIILMVSPWGRRENEIVIPWNIMMIGIVFLLFWREKVALKWPLAYPLSAQALIYLVLCAVLPALGYLGQWNSYLSFSVYSGAHAAGYAFIKEELATTLPREAVAASYPSAHGLRELPFDAWGALVLKAPPSQELHAVYDIARYLCRIVPEADNTLAFVVREPIRPWKAIEDGSGYLCKGGDIVPVE